MKKIFNLLLFVAILLLFTSCRGLGSETNRKAKTPDDRPNFLIIITDDQPYDTMDYMPNTQELIFDQGVTFSNGYITTSLCCPSRASILTGMYAHTHGVYHNEQSLEVPTFVYYLNESGYYTGLIGKYFTTYRMNKGDTPPPEYDFWVAISRGESRYKNPTLNINGIWERHQGEYITTTFENYGLKFLDQAEKKEEPFVLIFSVTAPHHPFTPAEEDKHLYYDLPMHEPPNFNEEDISDKPNWIIERNPLLTPEQIIEMERYRRFQILTLMPVDRAIKNLLDKLDEMGELDQTVIIFLSDQGHHWGEHRLFGKQTLYQESIKVPFAMRYPPLIPQPYIEDRVIGNIDIAPTLYDLAGLPIPAEVDGLSLVDLIQGEGDWRDGLLIEGWPGRGHYSAIHTGQYIYAETVGDKSEFYDLQNDPYELENLVDDPNYLEIVAELKVLLEQMNDTTIEP
jgi:arylsulfatase A-like enzyme